MGFKNSDTGEIFARARVKKVGMHTLEDMFDNFGGHESYATIKKMVKTFQGYYGKERVDKTTPVKVIDFELIE